MQQNPYAPIFDQAAAEYGVPADMLSRFSQIESGHNPNAVAPNGRYKGLFQMSDSLFQQHRPNGNIFDPTDNAYAAASNLSNEMKKFRTQYGREPTATDLYMIQQQGPAGYAAHVQNPDAPAWENMLSTGEGRQKGPNWARSAIWGNVPGQHKAQFGSVDNITSRQFMDLWRNKVEPGSSTPAAAPATPQRRVEDAFAAALEPTSAPDVPAARATPQGPGALTPPAAAPQGQTNMAADDQPSLSANFMAGGPGALFGAPGGVFKKPNGEAGYDFGHALQKAAGWMMALDNPKALDAALTPRDDFSLIATPDGGVVRINKKTGQVQQVQGSNPKIVQMGTDIAGNPRHVIQVGNDFFDPVSRQRISIPSMNAPQRPGVPGAPAGVPMSANTAPAFARDPFLAKGVTEPNDELTGDEYLKQYSPQVQAYVKDLVEGRVPVTANARKGFTTTANLIASKYGQEVGIPMDATSLAERRKLATEMAGTAPNLFGGQSLAVQQSLNHLTGILQGYDKLNNTNGLGSEMLARLTNPAHGSFRESTSRANAIKELEGLAGGFSGEAQKLIAGRTGGQEERLKAVKTLADPEASDTALRGGAKGYYELIKPKILELQDKLDKSSLPAAVKERYRVITPQVQKMMDDIEKRLNPDFRPTPAEAPAAKPRARILEVVPAQ